MILKKKELSLMKIKNILKSFGLTTAGAAVVALGGVLTITSVPVEIPVASRQTDNQRQNEQGILLNANKNNKNKYSKQRKNMVKERAKICTQRKFKGKFLMY